MWRSQAAWEEGRQISHEALPALHWILNAAGKPETLHRGQTRTGATEESSQLNTEEEGEREGGKGRRRLRFRGKKKKKKKGNWSRGAASKTAVRQTSRATEAPGEDKRQCQQAAVHIESHRLTYSNLKLPQDWDIWGFKVSRRQILKK